MDNRYKLHITMGAWNPPGSIVGSIRLRGEDRLVADIYLDDAKVYSSGAVTVTTVMYGEEPRIFITREKLEALQGGSDDELFELYHELGHIELGHYTALDSDEDLSARFEREELEADAFAAGILGKELCERVLRAMLKMQVEADKLTGRRGSESSVAAIRAIRRRIENVK